MGKRKGNEEGKGSQGKGRRGKGKGKGKGKAKGKGKGKRKGKERKGKGGTILIHPLPPDRPHLMRKYWYMDNPYG